MTLNQETQNESRKAEGQLSNVTTLEPVNTNSTRYSEIFARLARGKNYREAFVESEINIGIPFQIKAMREAREWTQSHLAAQSDKRQSVISQLETPGYGNLTLSTLKKLAAAFDVGLMVRFVSFGELARRAAHLSESDMKIPSFYRESGTVTGSTTTARSGFFVKHMPHLNDHYPARRDTTATTGTTYGTQEIRTN